MSQEIRFLGAAQTVTGSRHLLTLNHKKILVDCGVFQGSSSLSNKNRDPFGFDPAELDAVVITHAHQDHIGLLPRLVREGYRGPIYSTKATQELARISLPDSGRIQEEDARHVAEHPESPEAKPLYTEADAYICLKQFEAVPYEQFHKLPGGAQWRYQPAGHILGSAFAEIYFENGQQILMSGDLGRFDTPLIKDPTTVDFAEYLVIESTYGDRLHPKEPVMDELEILIKDAVHEGSALIVPSFAIGRTQEMLYFISRLQHERGLPRIPIYVDSPMAASVTEVYRRASEELDSETTAALKEQIDYLEPSGLQLVRDRETSKALNSQRGPLMIIAGSGMANGGRIVHHLIHRLGNPNTTVVFTGYQADGTLGRRLLEGAPVVHLYGNEIEVRARITKLNALSAHADQGEIMRWLGNFKQPPKNTFIVHGEPPAQKALHDKIVHDLGWPVEIPHEGQDLSLS